LIFRTVPVYIRNGLRLANPAGFNEAVRLAFHGFEAHLEVVITHAADARHAEIIVLEGGRRRAAYYADLNSGLDELTNELRRTLRLENP
jgi:hypothetical protein